MEAHARAAPVTVRPPRVAPARRRGSPLPLHVDRWRRVQSERAAAPEVVPTA
ncbi:hypothetical protein [Geodermatophilus sp. URMC 62]|uniref:hypothetical protein n=1 Tax=Geodermatophilus sp. URMC 62 TaxID=3423414 RepID=UPI00406C1A3B